MLIIEVLVKKITIYDILSNALLVLLSFLKLDMHHAHAMVHEVVLCFIYLHALGA